ncbi:hypothetical protein LINGRAPRIM_LOCUS768 [Linum grandiflorum]
MIALELVYAGQALFSKAAFTGGLSPRVFIVYRLLISSLIMAPLAFFSKRYVHLFCFLFSTATRTQTVLSYLYELNVFDEKQEEPNWCFTDIGELLLDICCFPLWVRTFPSHFLFPIVKLILKS